MTATLGEKIKLTIFGESHGLGIGCVIDGLPPGFAIDLDAVKKKCSAVRRAKARLQQRGTRKTLL